MYTLYNFISQVPTSLQEQINKDHYEKKNWKPIFFSVFLCVTHISTTYFHIFWQIMKQCVELYILGANVFSLSKNCSSLLFFSTRRRWRVQTDFWHWAQTSEEWKFFFSHLRAKPPMFANILIDSKSKRITPQKKKSAFPAHTLDGSCYSI